LDEKKQPQEEVQGRDPGLGLQGRNALPLSSTSHRLTKKKGRGRKRKEGETGEAIQHVYENGAKKNFRSE